jgi:hypothetical protein
MFDFFKTKVVNDLDEEGRFHKLGRKAGAGIGIAASVLAGIGTFMVAPAVPFLAIGVALAAAPLAIVSSMTAGAATGMGLDKVCKIVQTTKEAVSSVANVALAPVRFALSPLTTYTVTHPEPGDLPQSFNRAVHGHVTPAQLKTAPVMTLNV